jgi:hypothetical protein
LEVEVEAAARRRVRIALKQKGEIPRNQITEWKTPKKPRAEHPTDVVSVETGVALAHLDATSPCLRSDPRPSVRLTPTALLFLHSVPRLRCPPISGAPARCPSLSTLLYKSITTAIEFAFARNSLIHFETD